MNFNQKIQELRKQKGLTQEELAELLYVSRAAISKWESGRGYPNIDSLKAIAGFFGVTVDELLSGDELLAIAGQDNNKKQKSLRNLVFGLLDVSVMIFLFMPLFGQRVNGAVDEVSLLSLTGIAPYLKWVYFVIVIGMAVWGILTLALQGFNKAVWDKCNNVVSVVLNAVGVLAFIISLQPYAAAYLFVFLIIKALMLIKWQ